MASVLVLDDDATFGELTCRRLEKQDHEVTLHTEAETALPLIAGGKFDVLILDLSMPGVSGTDLLAALKQLPGFDKVHVILYSSGDTDRLARISVEYGVSHLSKSARTGELLRLVDEAAARGPKSAG